MINKLVKGVIPKLQNGCDIKATGPFIVLTTQDGTLEILYHYMESSVVSIRLDCYEMVDMYNRNLDADMNIEFRAVLKDLSKTFLKETINEVLQA